MTQAEFIELYGVGALAEALDLAAGRWPYNKPRPDVEVKEGDDLEVVGARICEARGDAPVVREARVEVRGLALVEVQP